MTLDDLTQKIKQKMNLAADLKARVKFNLGDDGVIYVDTTQNPPEISHEDKEADVELIAALDTVEAILKGAQDPNIAFMMGKLKVKGSMGLAMKLNAALED